MGIQPLLMHNNFIVFRCFINISNIISLQSQTKNILLQHKSNVITL